MENPIVTVPNQRIRLYIEGKDLCDRLSINEWNALFNRYIGDSHSTVINHLEDTENNRDYAIIETTLDAVLSKGAVMDLQFLRAVEINGKWTDHCLHSEKLI